MFAACQWPRLFGSLASYVRQKESGSVLNNPERLLQLQSCLIAVLLTLGRRRVGSCSGVDSCASVRGGPCAESLGNVWFD